MIIFLKDRGGFFLSELFKREKNYGSYHLLRQQLEMTTVLPTVPFVDHLLCKIILITF